MRSTRAFVRDESAKVRRQLTRIAGKKARFSAGWVRGYYARVRHVIFRPPLESDDAIVEQRIRSDALREVGVSTTDVEIDVEDGVVTLTGEVVGDKIASELVARIGKVPGVENVAAMLRVVAEQRKDRAA